MSRDKEVGEVVSAIISLVNNQYSFLVELLRALTVMFARKRLTKKRLLLLYHLIVLLQMETGNVPDRSNNISVSIGLQNVMGRYGRDKKAIRYNGNIL